MSDAPPPTLDDYGWTRDFPTRFSDNDVLGHLHNAVYYQAMDSTVLGWLLHAVDCRYCLGLPSHVGFMR